MKMKIRITKQQSILPDNRPHVWYVAFDHNGGKHTASNRGELETLLKLLGYEVEG